MKKVIVAIAVGSLLSTLGFVSPAQADIRLSLSANTNMVMFGTEVTLNPSLSSSGVLNPSDLALIRYEVTKPKSQPGSAKIVVWRLDDGQCPGKLVGSGGIAGAQTAYQACEQNLTRERQVFDGKTGTNSTYSSIAKIELTPLAGAATNYKVRVWADRNQNGKIDSFEPSSPPQLIQALNPAFARAYVNFGVDPLLVTESNFVSYLDINQTLNSGIAILDSSLIEAQVLVCDDRNPCRVSDLALSVNSHPQRQRLEFSAPLVVGHGFKYTINLYYNPFGQADLGRAYLLGSRTVDYRDIKATDASVSVFTARATSSDFDQVELVAHDDQTMVIVDPKTRVLRYEASLTDKEGKPVSGQLVYVRADLDSFANFSKSNFRIDGVEVNQALKDEVIVARTTDAQGKISIQVQANEQSWGSALALELITGGYRGKLISDEAKEQLVVWGADSTRRVSVKIDNPVAGAGQPVSFTVRNSRSLGSVEINENLMLDADEYLLLSSSRASSSSSISVNLSPLAPRNGSGKVTIQANNAGQIASKVIDVTWFDYGAKLMAELAPNSNPVVASGYQGPTKVSSGRTVTGRILLQDAFGDAIPNSPVTVSSTGPGSLKALARESDFNGQIPIRLILPAGDSGVVKINVKRPDSHVVSTHYVLVDVSAEFALLEDRLVVSVDNAKGAEVMISGSGVEARGFLPSQAVASYSIWDLPNRSSTMSVSVFGVQVASKSLNFNNLDKFPASATVAGVFDRGTIRVRLNKYIGQRVTVKVDGRVVDNRTILRSPETYLISGLKRGSRSIEVLVGTKVLTKTTVSVR